LCLLVALLGTAVDCAHKKPPGDSGHDVRTSAPVGSSQIDDFQPPQAESARSDTRRPRLVLPPVAVRRELPAYPEAALGDSVSCVAEILYHVETSGQATLVRLGWVEPPPRTHVAAFEDTIRTVMVDWLFKPAERVEPEQRPDGTIEPIRTPVPVAQHAYIRFRVENGTPVVD
jgi:hypothetical protein